ncbi:MAG: NAD-dependent epimerase/dehydratase family protein [Chloroflexi bacterium]|nr:NAD-dependent epimerase/dehydratase family protein [Chloroflexota bacterium]
MRRPTPVAPRADLIVVTGGAGFIGSHIVDALLDQGRRVLVLDDLSKGARDRVPKAAELVVIDVSHPDAQTLVAEAQPSAIVHCAAQTSVPESFVDPARDASTNVVGSINVIRGALAAGTRRFVYVTSGGAIYGAGSPPYKEDSPIGPASPYGWTKLAGERYLEMLATGKMSWVALRLANVYGPRQRADAEGGVVARFAQRMSTNESVTIDGDGEQTRDFVYVGDVVDAVLRAIESPVQGPLNIGTGRGTSVNQLFKALASIAGYSLGAIAGPPRPGDIRHSALSCERSRVEIGWTPHVDLEDGLRATYRELTT